MQKYEVEFDGNVCKGCELCVSYCPKGLIVMSGHINERGYSPAEIKNAQDCMGCKSCAVMCPDGAISISKVSHSEPSVSHSEPSVQQEVQQ